MGEDAAGLGPRATFTLERFSEREGQRIAETRVDHSLSCGFEGATLEGAVVGRVELGLALSGAAEVDFTLGGIALQAGVEVQFGGGTLSSRSTAVPSDGGTPRRRGAWGCRGIRDRPSAPRSCPLGRRSRTRTVPPHQGRIARSRCGPNLGWPTTGGPAPGPAQGPHPTKRGPRVRRSIRTANSPSPPSAAGNASPATSCRATPTGSRGSSPGPARASSSPRPSPTGP